MTLPFADATARNGPPILGVLRRELSGAASVLEIGSGTGQHAVLFGAALTHLTWQPSDLADAHAGIRGRTGASGLANVLPPVALDVRRDRPPGARYDAVFSANTAHIMSLDAVGRMFALAGAALVPGGRFCLYGPFAHAGAFSTRSNAAFDAALRNRDPAMGIRDLDDLDGFGIAHGLERRRLYAMPANNELAVWERRADGAGG